MTITQREANSAAARDQFPAPRIVGITGRFGVTLASNVVRAGFSFLAGLMTARALGTVGYGDLTFLLGNFTAITAVMDFGSASAFYTFLAQKRRSNAFVAIYFLWFFGVQLLGSLLILGLVLPPGVLRTVWVGQSRAAVVVGFAATFLMYRVWAMITQMAEARRHTFLVQSATALLSLAHCGLIAGGMWLHWLTVDRVLVLIILEYAGFSAVLIVPLFRMNTVAGGGDHEPLNAVLRSFWLYCTPLIVYSMASGLYRFANTWMLQKYAGSYQQGLFGVGQQFAAISLIAARSLMNVFWKEVAEAGERGDEKRIYTLFACSTRMLYVAGAWISCLLIPYSSDIVRISVGKAFQGAALPLAIMFLYPIHQALGQVTGTFAYATTETASYVKISIAVMLLSVPFTYLLIGPRNASIPGFDLGAAGVAISMVLVQIFSVNAQLWSITSRKSWRFEWGYQIYMLCGLLALAGVCRFVSGGIYILGILLYSAATLLILRRAPAAVTGLPLDYLDGMRNRYGFVRLLFGAATDRA